jgi:hypothetical protein
VAINAAGEARCEGQVSLQDVPAAPAPAAAPAKPAEEPKFVKALVKETKVNDGEPLTINTQIQSPAQPKNVVWTKNGVELVSSANVRAVSTYLDNGVRSYSLEFTQVTQQDEGNYAVTVFTDTKSISTQTVLRVSQKTGVAPKLMKMDDVEVLEGEAAQFRAEIVQGTPAPTITWFREDALIPENEDFAMLQEGRYAVLVIKSTFEEDSGMFKCKATNEFGVAETSARLTVTSNDE